MAGIPFKVDSPSGVYQANMFHLDYYAVSLSSDIAIPTIERLHVGDSNDLEFCWTHKNDRSWNPYGVTRRYLPSEEWPIQIVNSGVGCENFGYFYPRLDEHCREFGIKYRCSRVDFAFDVIMQKKDWRLFLNNVWFYNMMATENNVKTRWTVTGCSDESTLYFGSRGSHKYFRIYNKSLQKPDYQLLDSFGKVIDMQSRPDEYVIRFEVELKKSQTGGKQYTCDEYVSDYYKNPDKLAAELREMWKFTEEFNISVIGDCLKSSQQNKSFVQHVVEFGAGKEYVVEKLGKYVGYLLESQNEHDWRRILIAMWKHFGYNRYPHCEYLANPAKPDDFSWVSKYGIDPFYVNNMLLEKKADKEVILKGVNMDLVRNIQMESNLL